MVHFAAVDVLDWKIGRKEQIEYEMNLIYTAADVAAGKREYIPRNKKVRTKYAAKTREMIEAADRKDKQLGKIQ